MLKVNIHRQNDFPINIQFECDSGELHVLVGPSGSGKSTLIKGLSGVQPYDEGTVKFAGEKAVTELIIEGEVVLK